MTVFLAASQDISSSIVLGVDSEKRQLYNFTITLIDASRDGNAGVVVVGWAQGDDADETRSKIQSLMSFEAAAAALKERTAAANAFMTESVPQLDIGLLNATATEDVAVAGHGQDDFQVVLDSTAGKAKKYKFIKEVGSVPKCEAACAADPACMSFEFAHEPAGWCALFNVTVDPKANSTTKFDVGCRGKCASSPAPSPPSPPGPHPSPGPPPGPTPPPPAGAIRGVKDSYYFGWSQYWLM